MAPPFCLRFLGTGLGTKKSKENVFYKYFLGLSYNWFLFLKLMRSSVKLKNNRNEKNELLANILLFSKAGNSVKKSCY